MSNLSPLKSRRLANRKTEPTEQFVIFPILNHWFAIPLPQILRVIPFYPEAITPDITLIDLTQHLFPSGSVPSALPEHPFPQHENPLPDASAQSLILLQNQQGDTLGLILNRQPTMQRIPHSRLVRLSEDVAPSSAENFHTICTRMIQDGHNPQSIFILDPAKIYPKI
jgi:chemotaxis signal transduction protein